MDKNRGLIIAAVLLLIFGTGTFVFANPSDEDYSDFSNGPGNVNYSLDGTNSKNNSEDHQDIRDESINVSSNEEENSFHDSLETNLQSIPSVVTKPSVASGSTSTGFNISNSIGNALAGSGFTSSNSSENQNENPSIHVPSEGESEKNPDIPSQEEKPSEVLQPFSFVNNTSFSNSKIFIDEPNYGYMEVYVWPNLKDKIVVTEPIYSVSSNTTYTFVLYDVNGKEIKRASMIYDSVAPEITTSKSGDSITLTITDTDLHFIKRIYADGHEEMVKEFKKSDRNRKKYSVTFSESGSYKIVAIDQAGNEKNIEFSI